MREAEFSKDDPHNRSYCYYNNNHYYYHRHYSVYSIGNHYNGSFNFSFPNKKEERSGINYDTYSEITINVKKSLYQGITIYNDTVNIKIKNRHEDNSSRHQALYFKCNRHYLRSYHDTGRKRQILKFGNSTNSVEKNSGLLLLIFLCILKYWFVQLLLPFSLQRKRNLSLPAILKKSYIFLLEEDYNKERKRKPTVVYKVKKKTKILDLFRWLGCERYSCSPAEICGPVKPHRSMPSWEYSNVCRCIEDSNQYLHCCFLPPVLSAVLFVSKILSFACNFASLQSGTPWIYVLAPL